MAKPITQKIKLLSTAGHRVLLRHQEEPADRYREALFKKYDPVARKHVAFKETKIK